MSTTQQSLFDHNDLSPMPADRTLVIRPTATRPLNKQERAFNRALTKVQMLRVRLDEEKRRLDAALVFHAAEVRPRMERAVGLRAQLVRAIAPFLDDRRLKPADRTLLRAILVDQLDDILAHVDVPPPDLQTLFERLHGIAYTQAVQEDIEGVRSDMAAMFDELGVDVDVPELRANMSEEEIAVAAAQFADGMRHMEEARAGDDRNRRKTKRELSADERARRFAEMRKVSIGAVYKRLVKVLHPDLENDAAERQKKIGIMQEVTAAYARSDLHMLLRLELEWIVGAHADAAALSDEKLRAYTALLNEQAAELEGECQALRFHPRYAPLVVEGPYGLPTLIDGPSEAARLNVVIEQVRSGIEHMASTQALREVRRAIQEYRRAQKMRRRKQPRW
jgi:hypothetical protein